jgi:hypothetical protein
VLEVVTQTALQAEVRPIHTEVALPRQDEEDQSRDEETGPSP